MYPEEDEEEIPEGNERSNSISFTPAQTEALQWFFNYDSTFIQMEASLRGRQLKWNNDAKQFEIDMKGTAKSHMNEEGIRDTMSRIRSMITPIEAFTVFSDAEIRKKCLQMRTVMVRIYATKMLDYAMTSEDASFIIAMIMDKYDANLRKSLDGASMALTKGTTKTTYVKTDANKGGGLLSGLRLPSLTGR